MVSSPVARNCYCALSPWNSPYVEVGEPVGTEQTLCVVEAVGPVREIHDLPAGYSGDEMVEVRYRIIAEASSGLDEIWTEDAYLVERDQPLFIPSPRFPRSMRFLRP